MKIPSLAAVLISLMGAMLLTGCTGNTDASQKDNSSDIKEDIAEAAEKSLDSPEPQKKDDVIVEDVDPALEEVSSNGTTEHDPEFSYRDTTFIIDGSEIDVRESAPDATAIMDVKRVGDWIIVECHNNPNISTCLFYNIPGELKDCF